ncbi:hypothetical protein AAG596_10450 [Citromicrobium bathyomarinum]|uniref:hypothetical protein n=1 Tax=Citromicrobium bathyomarinum TaxID=72174 RepID=UPI00315B2AA4
MNQLHETLPTNAGKRAWSTPQVVDLDDRRAIAGGAVNAAEFFAPTFYSVS